MQNNLQAKNDLAVTQIRQTILQLEHSFELFGTGNKYKHVQDFLRLFSIDRFFRHITRYEGLN